MLPSRRHGVSSLARKSHSAIQEDLGSLQLFSVGVQTVMEDMARRQEKGEEIPDEELRAMEEDLTGKVSNALLTLDPL